MPDALFARIDGSVDVPVTDASVTWNQAQVATFTFAYPATDYPRDQLVFKEVALYRNGVQVVSGIIFEPAELEIDSDRRLLCRVSAYDELGRLMCYRAKATGHYQDQLLTTILNDLLATTSDWVLGDVTSMIDPSAMTTVDLRSRELLFSQVSEAVRSIPHTFLRYGGFSGGFHRLDVGFFGEDTTYLVQHESLTSLRLTRNTDRVYRVVEAYGDRSANRRVSLFDALSDPRTTVHPDYAQFPISLDPVTGTYVVTNTVLSDGCEITKQFQVHKTRNDQEPTPSEIAEAGYALWQRAVRFLQSTAPYIVMTARALLDDVPLISDDAYVKAAVLESRYNQVELLDEWHETFNFADWLRMTKITVRLANSGVTRGDAVFGEDGISRVEAELELTNNSYAEDFDDSRFIYEELKPADVADEVLTIGVIAVFTVTVTHNTVADPPDAACLPDIAKEFVFPVPAAPPGATSLFGVVVAINPPAADVQITQYPSFPSTPLIACVQIGGDWDAPAQDVAVTVRYEFI